MSTFDRLAARAVNEAVRFEVVVMATTGWVTAYYGGRRASDRWRGSNEFEELLRALERRLDEEKPCSPF